MPTTAATCPPDSTEHATAAPLPSAADLESPATADPPPGPVAAAALPHKLATAADLPPELISLIALYIGTEANGSDRFSLSPDDVHDLCTCSLVCVDWAERCRVYFFPQRALCIRTLAELMVIFSYSVNGSRRLTPLTKIVPIVVLELSWEASLHEQAISPFIASIPDLQSRRLDMSLYLNGPVPEHLPRRAYRSPPWTHNLPKSIPGCFLPFSSIRILSISFPFLSDIIALLGHFQTGREVGFYQLTWHSTDTTIPPARPLTLRPRWWPRVHVYANNCTDDVLLSLLALCRIDPPSGSIFANLTRRELKACILLFRALEETEYDHGQEKPPFGLDRPGTHPLHRC